MGELPPNKSSTKGGKSRVRYGRAVPSPTDQRSIISSQWGPGTALAGNTVWRILKATECSFQFSVFHVTLRGKVEAAPT